MNLVTGGADTDIVVWDCISRQGVLRLRGHKDAITAVEFLSPEASGSSSLAATEMPAYVVSGSKDGFVKVWELKTQHCVQTIVGHRAEVWSLAISPCRTRLATGTNDANLRVWALPSNNAAAADTAR
jgi:U3 small nucleolar RNA-associated protein 12